MTRPPIEALLFDVLGTLVDEPDAIRRAIRSVSPATDESGVAEGLGVWQRRIAHEQGRIARGERPYEPSDVLDREAAEAVATALGIDAPASLLTLATATQRCLPWPDAAEALTRIAARFPVIALSNASHGALLHLNRHAGLRWHQIITSEDVGRYKPDQSIYRHAIDLAGTAPERVLMVAAHAWDLRGAATAGMRTAFIDRPVADPPTPSDRFDLHAQDLEDLAIQLAS